MAKANVRTREKKRCPDCNRLRSIEDFGNDRSRPDGKDGICKPCRRERRLAREK